MAKIGINTGSAPNQGDGSTLLQGAIAINSNFDEIYSAIGDGSVVTDISLQFNSPSGVGTLTYTNRTLTFTPPDLSSVGSGITYGDLSVSYNSPSGIGTLDYNNTNGTLTFTPPDLSSVGSGITYGDLSVSYNSPSGIGTLDYNNTNGTLTFTPPDLSSVGSGITSIGIIDNSSLIGVTTNISFPGFGVTISSGIATFTNTRTTASATTGSIGVGNTGNISITASKTYVLYSIETSYPAWITLYTDSASRTADASRLETQDPLPGSGVIAEVITTSGNLTQLITPGTIGFNNDSTPSSTVYAKVVNKHTSTVGIAVTLKYLKLED